MSETQTIGAGDVAEPTGGNAEGKSAVIVDCGECGKAAGQIHVPPDITDPTIRYEHRCAPGKVWRGEWPNPNGVAIITDPGPDDDVIFDGRIQAWVPRVAVSAGEGGTGVEAATAQAG